MARGKPPAAPRRSFVASGKNIRLDDRAAAAQHVRRERESKVWQSQAFYFNKAVSLLGFAHDYTRDSLSRVTLVPAIWPDDPAERPVPLDDESAPNGLDPDLAKEILSRLEPFPSFMGRSGQLLDISGEHHVALVADDDDVDGEKCMVLSTQELFLRDGRYFVRDDISDNIGRPLVRTAAEMPDRVDAEHPPLICSDGGFFRVWQNDPEFWQMPYSHMIRLMSESDTLLTLTQMLRGIARSRIAMNGRILAIADELLLASASGSETAGDGEARANSVIDDLMTAAVTAITDPESAAAVLPLIMVASKEAIKDGLVSIDLDRPIDEMALKWREELRNDIATGVNLPREILLGIGETNHWNAEEIKTQAWRNHLEPRSMGITSAVTEAFFRPQLLAEGVDPDIVRRACVWYDPQWFIGTPDLASDADAAYQEYAISGEAYRRAKGWTEDDAPDLQEVEYRLWVDQQRRLTLREQVEGPASVEGAPTGPGDEQADEAVAPTEEVQPKAPPAPSGQAPRAETVPQTPQTTTPAKPKAAAAAITAAQAPRRARLARLGPRLATIERDLRTRIQAEANAEVARTLDRAGVKVMAAASKKNRVLAAEWKAHPLGDVCAVAGPAAIAMLGLNDQDLLAGALNGLEGRWRTQVTRAQRAALQAAADASGRDFDPEELDRLSDSRDHGWALMAAGLGALLAAALYNPHPSAPPRGEFDQTSLVPLGLVRGALGVAGGATAPPVAPAPALDEVLRALDGRAVDYEGGATAGPEMGTIFADSLGIEKATRTWTVGEPDRPFEPHQELEGVTFTEWDDPQLENPEDWPPVDYFIPGDHAGCECSIEYEWTLTADAAEEAA